MVSLARSQTTFRLIRTIPTRKLVGPGCAIGLVPARSPSPYTKSLFQEARAFACSLGLNSQSEWRDYCKMAPIECITGMIIKKPNALDLRQARADAGQDKGSLIFVRLGRLRPPFFFWRRSGTMDTAADGLRPLRHNWAASAALFLVKRLRSP